MNAPVRGILFDMDDTLIDWYGFSGGWSSIEQTHLARVYRFLEEMERPLKGSLETVTEVYTRKVRDQWEEARVSLRAPHMGRILMQTLAHFGVIPDENITMESCIQAYGWQGLEEVTLFPDVIPVLKIFRERGIHIGIVTNAMQPMTMRDAELARYGLLEFFPDVRLSAADVGWLKPHPKIFQVALEQLGTTPQETLYVGDNPVADIAGAQGAGMRAVLRVNHAMKPLISGLIVPDAAVNSFDELLVLLDEWGI